MSIIEPAAPEIVLPSPKQSPWTEERTERCKAMWAEGNSATAIALELGAGITRNAVIGKLHRMGQFRERTRVQSQTQVQTTKLAAKKRRFRKMLHEAWERTELEPETLATAVMIDKLKEHHCRWPVNGSGVDMLYCGSEIFPAMSYCPRHCRIAYRPAR